MERYEVYEAPEVMELEDENDLSLAVHDHGWQSPVW